MGNIWLIIRWFLFDEGFTPVVIVAVVLVTLAVEFYLTWGWEGVVNGVADYLGIVGGNVAEVVAVGGEYHQGIMVVFVGWFGDDGALVLASVLI